MFIRCPYCHRRVLRWFYAWHEKKHTRRRSDGQMSEHVTALPETRYSGSLAEVPQGYLHPACGVVTRMPEEIIRTYLVNPMTYSDGSFCCGCGDYIDSSQLVWQETGEKVMDYMGRLRLGYLRTTLGMSLPDRPTGIVVTPRAVRELKASLRGVGEASASIVLCVPDASSTGFKLDVASSVDERSETVISSSGISIIVPKKHTERVSGVVIDYLESPQRGFSIARLYAPSGTR
jgi:Fe-S cluster assembly iron-binding protein IscA